MRTLIKPEEIKHGGLMLKIYTPTPSILFGSVVLPTLYCRAATGVFETFCEGDIVDLFFLATPVLRQKIRSITLCGGKTPYGTVCLVQNSCFKKVYLYLEDSLLPCCLQDHVKIQHSTPEISKINKVMEI